MPITVSVVSLALSVLLASFPLAEGSGLPPDVKLPAFWLWVIGVGAICAALLSMAALVRGALAGGRAIFQTEDKLRKIDRMEVALGHLERTIEALESDFREFLARADPELARRQEARNLARERERVREERDRRREREAGGEDGE